MIMMRAKLKNELNNIITKMMFVYVDGQSIIQTDVVTHLVVREIFIFGGNGALND